MLVDACNDRRMSSFCRERLKKDRTDGSDLKRCNKCRQDLLSLPEFFGPSFKCRDSLQERAKDVLRTVGRDGRFYADIEHTQSCGLSYYK